MKPRSVCLRAYGYRSMAGWKRNVACFYNNLLRGVVENAVFAIDLQTFCALHTTICLVVRYTIIMII